MTKNLGLEMTIFGLKMMVKSGLENIILKFLHAQSLFWIIFFASKKGRFLHQIANSVIKMTFAHGQILIKLFVVYLHIINECLGYKFHPYSILTGQTKVESGVNEESYFKKHAFFVSTS